MDAWIVLSTAGSYVFFLSLHLTTFRFASPQNVLTSLTRTLAVTGVWHAGCLYWVYMWLMRDVSAAVPAPGYFPAGAGAVLTGGALSYFLLGLVLFVHVLCLFGPYETSIRLRLVRELHRGPKDGMSKNDVLKNYNGKIILEKRLDRLTASGELAQNGESNAYRINKNTNVFFIIDVIVRWLQKASASQRRFNV